MCCWRPARRAARPRRVRHSKTQPRLDALLPLVALGTVADVVKLDANNRRLVAQGLRRMRAGALPCPAWRSCSRAAGRDASRATTFDLGFALGPRINAAGRLADMTLGIECLLTDDPARADELARTLDGINRERREIETGMREQAFEFAARRCSTTATSRRPPSACSTPTFHEGVVGIVAARLKDRLHRPAFVFAASQAPGKEHERARADRLTAFHLRDALDLVAKRHPGVLLRFGGHAMAAGCTIAEDNLDTFDEALQQVALERLDAATLTRRLATDGPLEPQYRRTELVDTLQHEVWGQGFARPCSAKRWKWCHSAWWAKSTWR
jgi:single-stranded-DNA-specific exonuclease